MAVLKVIIVLFFNQKTLPTGVYFFVFLHNDEFLAKGKFTVVP